MQTCPACGTPTPPELLACSKCRLAVALFDPVREAVGVPRSDPKYVEEIGEILAALDQAMPEPAGTLSYRPQEGVITQPARFPAPPIPTTVTIARPARPPSRLPALPPGHGPELWRRQIDEYLRLCRRLGIDVSDFARRTRDSIQTEDPASLEALSRELYVRLAAALTEELEATHKRRAELARWTETPTLDAELEAVEEALAMGDLGGVDRRLRRLTDEIDLLDEEWETIQILITGADLIEETIRELGGDPAPALGPFEEGRRLAQAGKRLEAEPLLAHANVALWAVLAPLLTRDLGRLKELVLRMRSEGTDVREAALQLREIAVHLRHRNLAGLITAYRRLRALSEPWTAGTDPALAMASADGSFEPPE